MIATEKVKFVRDVPSKKITIIRDFDATVEQVWRAWTEKEFLDQWWAPEPWKAETKFIDFRDGGYWLYAMIGPDKSQMWCRIDYSNIKDHKGFHALDVFCDENGKATPGMPQMKWKNEFRPNGQRTSVTVEISFTTEEDLNRIVEMGFEAGFTSALTSLDHYLSTGFKLRKEMKNSHAVRVATYLNFPGTTEEALRFYQKVFRGEFTGRGIQRFGDIPAPEGAPPMSDADKKLVIFAELRILGGHILMATDAVESMGLKLERGNNMHINVEPETREETKRLFDELSVGGEVSMPLQDMFWGAYFASFKDRYGINWMLNFQL